MLPLAASQLPICIALGLIPGAYAFWQYRRWAGRVDDPAFPQHHLASQLNLGRLTFMLTLLGVAAGWGRWQLVTVAVMPLALALGSYPSRRKVWGETWSLLDYAASRLGHFAAVYGFWTLVSFGPVIVLGLAGPAEVRALALFLALTGWVLCFDRLVPGLLRAVPLADQELMGRFREIAARSTAPMPEVFRSGAPGGVAANALAIPGRRPRVVMGRTLLQALSPEEAAAVFAHEQAHLEEYRGGESRTLARLVYGLIIGATVVVLLAETRETPDSANLVAWGWWLAVGVIFGQRFRNQKKHELASDRRAAELCGDVDTYARALTRLHSLMNIPPRWSDAFERASSHPSLTRRLAALRGTPSDPAPLAVLVLADATEPGLVLVLDQEGCRWFAGVEGPVLPDVVPITGRLSSRLRYEDLVEVKVKGTELESLDRQGFTWRLAMTPADTERVHALLDSVGDRVGQAIPARELNRGRWKLWLTWGTLGALVLYVYAQDGRRPKDRPAPPPPAATEASPTFTPLSPEQSARLDHQRILIGSAVEQRYRRKLTGTKSDLRLLQRLLDDGFYSRPQTYELQALGVVLGDVLVSELPLRWVSVTDQHGTDPTLRLRLTSWQFNALTMISKRVERGEEVDVAVLFEGTRAAIAARE